MFVVGRDDLKPGRKFYVRLLEEELAGRTGDLRFNSWAS